MRGDGDVGSLSRLSISVTTLPFNRHSRNTNREFHEWLLAQKRTDEERTGVQAQPTLALHFDFVTGEAQAGYEISSPCHEIAASMLGWRPWLRCRPLPRDIPACKHAHE